MSPALPAYVFTILTGIVILFQMGLAAGLPWGAASMGGKFPGKYPKQMRWVAGLNIFILIFLSLIVLCKAGRLLPAFYEFSHYGIWAVVAFSCIGTILNTITPSKIERIWAPVALTQTICSFWVAIH
jgi:hypothetical protein